MKLTNDQVKHVAKLANLPLTDEELNTYAVQLSEVLEYADQLNKVNTGCIEPTFNNSGNINIFREDEIKDSLSQEDALSNSYEKSYFKTKGVFQED